MVKNELLAINLRKLAEEHKTQYNNPDCDIQVFPFLALFEGLIGREATPEEKRSFF